MHAPRMANVAGRRAPIKEGTTRTPAGALLESFDDHTTGLTTRSLCTIEQWAPTRIAHLDRTVDPTHYMSVGGLGGVNR